MAHAGTGIDVGGGRQLSVAPGEYVYRAGDSAGDLLIIRAGQIELTQGLAGTEQRVAVLNAGDVFGELELLERAPREASARAVTPCELLAIDSSVLFALFRRRPEIAAHLIRRVARSLSESRRQLLAVQEAIGSGHGKPPAGLPRTGAGHRAVHPASEVPVTGTNQPAQPPEPAAAPPGTDQTIADVGRAQLIEERPDGSRIPHLLRRTTTIGRTVRNTIVIPAADVSRTHARIDRTGAAYVLRDLGSQNGTFVNGQRITEHPLADNDAVRIGDRASFQFVTPRHP